MLAAVIGAAVGSPVVPVAAYAIYDALQESQGDAEAMQEAVEAADRSGSLDSLQNFDPAGTSADGEITDPGQIASLPDDPSTMGGYEPPRLGDGNTITTPGMAGALDSELNGGDGQTGTDGPGAGGDGSSLPGGDPGTGPGGSQVGGVGTNPGGVGGVGGTNPGGSGSGLPGGDAPPAPGLPAPVERAADASSGVRSAGPVRTDVRLSHSER